MFTVKVEGMGFNVDGKVSVGFRMDDPSIMLNGQIILEENIALEAKAKGGDALETIIVDKLTEMLVPEEGASNAVLKIYELIEENQKKNEEEKRELTRRIDKAVLEMTMLVLGKKPEEDGENEEIPPMPEMPEMPPEE